jgi:hypothetical protein
MRKNIFFLTTACVAMVCLGSTAQASLTIVSSVGGQPASGVNYLTLNDLALGGGGGSASNTISTDTVTVSFTPDAQVVVGAASGLYAAPVLSNGNGANFGGQADGVDATNYITSGKDGSPNVGAAATLTFSGLQKYFGLLWGSVDDYNTLSFYNGATLVGTITGAQVTPTATGDQGVNGTFYVNINSTLGFDKVVATSSNYAFEFDNVAYSQFALVPEPGTMIIWSAFAGLGLVGARRRRNR